MNGRAGRQYSGYLIVSQRHRTIDSSQITLLSGSMGVTERGAMIFDGWKDWTGIDTFKMQCSKPSDACVLRLSVKFNSECEKTWVESCSLNATRRTRTCTARSRVRFHRRTLCGVHGLISSKEHMSLHTQGTYFLRSRQRNTVIVVDKVYMVPAIATNMPCYCEINYHRVPNVDVCN